MRRLPTLGSPSAIGWVLVVTTFAVALSMAACSFLPKRYYPVSQDSIRDLPVITRYVKHIGVASFGDFSGTATGSDLVRSFESTMSAALGRNCGNVEIVVHSADDAPSFLRNAPRMDSQAADTYTLAQTARQSGFQVIIRGGLLSLNHRVKRSGWSRYRKTHHFIDLRLEVEALDTITAAKIAEQSQTITLPIDEETGAAIDAGKRFDLPELVETITDVGVDMALKLCASVRAQPWETVVSEVRGHEMVLAATPAAGLEPGDRLAVFEGSHIINGYDDERFVLAGFRLGTVVVARKSGGEILASGENGGVFPAGSILIPVH
jgi:hypothetical protein